MINIVLFGPPGSGKGTQAQLLIDKFNLKQISTGDLFRYNMKNDTDLGKLAKSYIDKGELVPDQVTIDMLVDELRKPTNTNGFIFDGFPRTAHQTDALENIVKDELGTEISVCLSLVVDDEALVQRLLKRGETSGRTDNYNEEIIRNRIKEYYAKTAEVAELYKNRWQVELFFKWLKQHLKIKRFWGTTENAVRIQIYAAICAYCLVAIIQHDMQLDRSTYEVLQILSIFID